MNAVFVVLGLLFFLCGMSLLPTGALHLIAGCVLITAASVMWTGAALLEELRKQRMPQVFRSAREGGRS